MLLVNRELTVITYRRTGIIKAQSFKQHPALFPGAVSLITDCYRG